MPEEVLCLCFKSQCLIMPPRGQLICRNIITIEGPTLVLLMHRSYSRLMHFKYLWLLVYLWVHLRAEEREQTHSVPLSEVVPLSIGHVQDLVLHHLSSDHYCSSEP